MNKEAKSILFLTDGSRVFLRESLEDLSQISDQGHAMLSLNQVESEDKQPDPILINRAHIIKAEAYHYVPIEALGGSTPRI